MSCANKSRAGLPVTFGMRSSALNPSIPDEPLSTFTAVDYIDDSAVESDSGSIVNINSPNEEDLAFINDSSDLSVYSEPENVGFSFPKSTVTMDSDSDLSDPPPDVGVLTSAARKGRKTARASSEEVTVVPTPPKLKTARKRTRKSVIDMNSEDEATSLVGGDSMFSKGSAVKASTLPAPMTTRSTRSGSSTVSDASNAMLSSPAVVSSVSSPVATQAPARPRPQPRKKNNPSQVQVTSFPAVDKTISFGDGNPVPAVDGFAAPEASVQENPGPTINASAVAGGQPPSEQDRYIDGLFGEIMPAIRAIAAKAEVAQQPVPQAPAVVEASAPTTPETPQTFMRQYPDTPKTPVRLARDVKPPPHEGSNMTQDRYPALKSPFESRRSPTAPGSASSNHADQSAVAAFAAKAFPASQPKNDQSPNPGNANEGPSDDVKYGLPIVPLLNFTPDGSSQEVSDDNPAKKTKTLEEQSTWAVNFIPPARCEVYDEDLQDDAIRHLFEHLCPLPGDKALLPTFVTAQEAEDSRSGGRLAFSEWKNNLQQFSVSTLLSAISFVRSGRFINGSRAPPTDVVMRPANSRANPEINAYRVCVGDVGAICVSVGMCTFSSLGRLAPAANNKFKKYIAIVLHNQDWERFESWACVCFNEPVLYCQMSGKAIQLSTRLSTSEEASEAQEARLASQSMFKYVESPKRTVSPKKATSVNTMSNIPMSLGCGDTVPVYDARNADVDFNVDLVNLDSKLPRWRGGEVPVGAFVVAGYSMHSYMGKAQGRQALTLSNNVLWVVICGLPLK
ncbi:hypothetical protein R3P38DRAFT_2796510 [Favolaschia claudopus]|uniref:Uncharacterized protein n=1 Tax=Favolaschia claudopus TaxID=2862362 RepID=A0AAW0A5W3_9AGAR